VILIRLEAIRGPFRLSRAARSFAASSVRTARRVASALERRWRLAALLAASFGALVLLPTGALLYHVHFDRSGLPDLEPFVRFELPTTGSVYDAQGKLLIELATEYRQVVSYDEVPFVLREAVLAAEDKNYFSHSGVDYTVLPRVVYKTAAGSLAAWRAGGGVRPRFHHGGSTLTQQLVRSYFLQARSSHEDGDILFHPGLAPRLVSAVLGVPAANKLLRKVEEVRLALWLEGEMRRRYGSRERAKREIFARFASFLYLGNGRYGFAAGSEYYFGKPLASYQLVDAGRAALLAGINKAPRDYAPVPGDPRVARRRNQILAHMARKGSIPAGVASRGQAEPIPVVAPDPFKTHAPAAIENVFVELKQHGAGRFGLEDLFQGRISVRSTVDGRVQTIVNEALENGLARYEARRPRAKGLIQGSVVVLRNADAAILAEAGGRQVYKARRTRYFDYNRARGSLRQPGSAWKPLVYLTAFRQGLRLDSTVPDEPIAVAMGGDRGLKWIANYDNRFKGPMPMRQALAESRNAVAVWLACEVGMNRVLQTARELGIRTPLQPYISTALGASEVRLLELAGVYRAMASGVLAEPHIIERVTDRSGAVIYEARRDRRTIHAAGLSLIQEGLRGVVRLPGGTAHGLDRLDFPVPVMGKTGTTSDFRDALFVGSTYGPEGITVAVRIGFDDNRGLGNRETGGRTALPIFREIMLRTYEARLVGPVPRFPPQIEEGIDGYLAADRAGVVAGTPPLAPAEGESADATRP